MGDFIKRTPQWSMETFHAFYEDRPKSEKWELIDGVPMMMAPPTLIHQRISRNIETLLNARLAEVRPQWQADREIGLLLTDDDRFNPEPDVTVIDTDIGAGQVYGERFYFVAEVLSPSNRPEMRTGSDRPVVLAAKLDFYRGHEHCRGVLIAEQERIEARLYTRVGANWIEVILDAPEDRIVVPDIGDIGSLGELYRHTPLAPVTS